jgi:cobalt-precorrin 5A hydrolase/precorrin-3B C17-methyltransferase
MLATLWIGVGYERSTSRQVIEEAIWYVLQTHHLNKTAIAGIATLDSKIHEPSLVELCCDRNWPLYYFSPEELRIVSVPNPSAGVEMAVSTPSVAEAAAILGANRAFCTHASTLLVPKQIFRLPDQPGAVTVAVAEVELKPTGYLET